MLRIVTAVVILVQSSNVLFSLASPPTSPTTPSPLPSTLPTHAVSESVSPPDRATDQAHQVQDMAAGVAINQLAILHFLDGEGKF